MDRGYVYIQDKYYTEIGLYRGNKRAMHKKQITKKNRNLVGEPENFSYEIKIFRISEKLFKQTENQGNSPADKHIKLTYLLLEKEK